LVFWAEPFFLGLAGKLARYPLLLDLELVISWCDVFR
jgi:hypothetical protein